MCDSNREVVRVFEYLNEQKIRYCHWKSNAHLADSFSGKTDFDLLVAPEDAPRLRDCFQYLGIKRRLGTPDKVYPGMEDYLGFDAETGDLFHLHVHFQLLFGRKLEKNYRLPIEREILATAIEDPVFPIKKIRPELELMVLVIRSILKSPQRLHAASKLLRNVPIFPSNIVNEFDYLVCRVDRGAFDACTSQHFPALAAVFHRMVEGNINRLSYRELRKFQQQVRAALAPHRLLGDRELAEQRRAKRAAARQSRTWLGRGGICVAFVGADGAGKSSIVADVARWLGWKLSVTTAYMGIPKNDLWLSTLKLLTRTVRKVRCRALEETLKRQGWLHVARRRYQTYRHCLTLKKQDYLVLCDRYPLNELRSMEQPMDGPRITERSAGQGRELSLYNRIRSPDMTFVLRVTKEESIRRHRQKTIGNSCDEDTIARKVSAVDHLLEQGNGKFIGVDTLQGKEQTLLNIKRKLWEVL